MELNFYMDKLFFKYNNWLENGTFTREDAAFEFMKRNPYFIKLSLYYLECKKNPRQSYYSSEEILHIMKQVFFYTGSDLRKKVEDDSFVNLQKQQLFEYMDYDDANAESHFIGSTYWYSDIYHADLIDYQENNIDKYHSSSENKKRFPIDLDVLLGNVNKERWLEHLQPSINIKFNPLKSVDELVDNFKVMLEQISEKNWENESEGIYSRDLEESKIFDFPYSQYSSPEILLNEAAILQNKYKTDRFHSKPMLISLIMYDLFEIFKVTGIEEVSSVLKKYFGNEAIEKYFSVYFSDGGKYKNYALTLKTTYIRTKIKDIEHLINGGYLKYLYQKDTIDIHDKLIKNAYLNLYFNENMTDMKKSILDHEYLHLKSLDFYKFNNFTGKINLKSFTENEYNSWRKNIFQLLNEKKAREKIFDIILL